jgi:hypothetical protein
MKFFSHIRDTGLNVLAVDLQPFNENANYLENLVIIVAKLSFNPASAGCIKHLSYGSSLEGV